MIPLTGDSKGAVTYNRGQLSLFLFILRMQGLLLRNERR